jgi:hypothetical protein
MIWHNIITFFFNIAQFIVGFLPDLGDNDLTNINNITNAFQSFRGYLVTANMFFPVDLAFTCLTLIIGFEVALAVWKLIRWLGSLFSVGIIK